MRAERRWLRWGPVLLSVVSLAAAAAFLISGQYLVIASGWRVSGLTILRGQLYVEIVPYSSNEWGVSRGRLGGWAWELDPVPRIKSGGLLGGRVRVFRLPLHTTAVFLAMLAWMWNRTLRRRGRRTENVCTRCGYDQRGLAAGTACPECGCAVARR